MERAEMDALISKFLATTGWTLAKFHEELAHKEGFGGERSVEQWTLRIRNGKAKRITSTRLSTALTLLARYGVYPSQTSAHRMHSTASDSPGVGGEIMVKLEDGEWEAVGFRDAERFEVGTILKVRDPAGEYYVTVEKVKGIKVFVPKKKEGP